MKQWYAGRMVEDLLSFKKGEVVYYRSLEVSRPLKVGPVTVIFRSKNPASIRVCNSIVLRTVFHCYPNAAVPNPAPETSNIRIERAYQEFLEKHPIAKRHSATESARILSLHQHSTL